MADFSHYRGLGRIAFAGFFVSLFLMLTPFEQGGDNPSMFPRYFSAGAAALALAPMFAFTPVHVRVESQFVMVVMAMVAFHTLVVNPAPFHFTLLIMLNMGLAIVMYETSFAWRKQFVAAGSLLLMINAFVIVLQAALFYLTGGPIIDFHKMLFGAESRFVEDFLNIARFTGLQVEPGNYANFMGCLTAILIITGPFSRRLAAVCFVGVLTIFVTNSGSAAYFVPVLVVLMGYFWRAEIRATHVILLFGALAAYIALSGVAEHLASRFLENDDPSLNLRIQAVTAWKVLGLDDKLIGVGYGRDPCVRCFYQDIGMIFNLLTRGGLVVTMAFALLLARMLYANGLLVAGLLILVPIDEKMYFYETPIWLYFLFAMTRVATVRPARGRLRFDPRTRAAPAMQAGPLAGPP